VLRDLLVNEIPIVFIKEFYASASFAGVLILFLMLSLNINLTLSAIMTIIVVTSIRLIAIKFNWNLPRARRTPF
jgi:uncharacterized membrane protein YeiH